MYDTERSYLNFTRARIDMSGPETDELVSAGLIRSPQTSEICTANFPLGSENHSELLVFVPVKEHWEKTLEEVLGETRLKPPEPRHAIRFVSQFRQGNVFAPHIKKNIIFPHLPYMPANIKFKDMSGQEIGNTEELLSCFLVSAWRESLGAPELCLWSAYRDWSKNSSDFLAGVAAHLQEQPLPKAARAAA